MPPISLAVVLTHWNFEPTVIAGLVALVAAFVALQRRPEMSASRGGQIGFGFGIVLLALALLSPLDELSDKYLLTAHMIQHLLLVLAIAPVLAYAIPRPWARRISINPLLALILFNVVFAFSHTQVWYEATLIHEPLHVIEHVLYLATGILNWLPILSPARERRLREPLQMLYLFAETLPMFLVGALLALSHTAVYPLYERAPRIVSMTAVQDQSLAGLLMWIGTAFFYLGACTVVFFKWANKELGLDDETIEIVPLPSQWEGLGEGSPATLGAQSSAWLPGNRNQGHKDLIEC